VLICFIAIYHRSGHATRVVALTQELLLRKHNVYMCTNAPEHVFSAALSEGASYRNADIDAGIVQPKAYDVARRETVDGLKRFLAKREEKLAKEVDWLKRIKADAVLVDAPFLPWCVTS
jgi:L-arabinokinase